MIASCILAKPGWRDRDGYAYAYIDGRKMRAHRWAWEQVNGPIPEGMIVRHICDQPDCINERHLLLGTQRDNIHDMLARRRFVGRRGQRPTTCKRGHVFDEANTYTWRGERQCRTCASERARTYRSAS